MRNLFRLKLLPWEYGVRNLFRRASRTLLTLGGMTIVILLVLIVVAFIRGLESSLAASGDEDVVLVYSISSAADIENSSIEARVPALIGASLDDVQQQYGVKHISPEIYLGTRVEIDATGEKGLGLVRGVTQSAPLVRSQVRLVEGAWPEAGELLVGRLAYSKLGCREADLAIGQTVSFDGRQWPVSGVFAADGSAFESELWCDLETMQLALKRQDISLAAFKITPGAPLTDIQMFCAERPELELKAVRESEYYASLQQHYRPVRMLGWAMVWMIAGAGVFTGLNTMYGAVVGRMRELSTLQAIGFRRAAITLSLIQESTLLATAGSLLACLLAFMLVNGTAVRFTMGAFALKVDSVAVLIGCATGLVLGVVGALPPAIKAMRASIVDGIKAI